MLVIFLALGLQAFTLTVKLTGGFGYGLTGDAL